MAVGSRAIGSGAGGSGTGGAGSGGAGNGAASRNDLSAADTDTSRTQFERICDYLTEQFGVVRQVEAGQMSASMLLDLAEGELSELKRDLAATRLGATRR